MSDYRSYSQLNTFKKCPEAYRLERIEKVSTRTAAWFPMGTAVHSATESWERSNRTMSVEQAQQVYKDVYTEETNLLLEKHPELDKWFWSGRYDGKADIERRFLVGQEHVARYIRYYLDHPDQTVWITPEGDPALELRMDLDLDGVKIRGYIDAVITDPSIGTVVRDTKSGAQPGDIDQLTLYSMGIEAMFPGEKIAGSDFFMTKAGEPTKLADTSSKEVRDKLTLDFTVMDHKVTEGEFIAKPDPKLCSRCPVSDHCKFKML